MHAEILAIGSELTSGAKLDTNSQWLSTELAALGIPVLLHTTVADEMPALLDALGAGTRRADLLLVTGGLGPTQDDLTRQALAELLGRELKLHEPSLRQIRAMFARRGLSMPERNQIQAMFPHGSEVLVNPIGTAPGIWIEVPRPDANNACCVAALPGVPSEMRRMFQEQVVPRLPRGRDVIRRARIHCFGAGESAIEEMLGDLTTRGQDPEVGITAHDATITLRITAHGHHEQECSDKIRRTKELVGERLGNLIFGEADEDLAHTVVRALTARQLRLATAEAGTQGLLTHWMARADVARQSYAGGCIAPDLYRIPDLRLEDASSPPTDSARLESVAQDWAATCRERFRADLGLAVVVRSLGQEADESADDTPTSVVGLVGDATIETAQWPMAGNPTIFESRTAKAALNVLRLYLLELGLD